MPVSQSHQAPARVGVGIASSHHTAASDMFVRLEAYRTAFDRQQLQVREFWRIAVETPSAETQATLVAALKVMNEWELLVRSAEVLLRSQYVLEGLREQA